jgi:hypothetical protein
MFQRLLPVIPVADVEAEVAFYLALGFAAEPTHSGFTALRHGRVLFGVQSSDEQIPPVDLRWQIEVDDIQAAHQLASRPGLEVRHEPSIHPAGFWTLHLGTPNGYASPSKGQSAPPTIRPPPIPTRSVVRWVRGDRVAVRQRWQAGIGSV